VTINFSNNVLHHGVSGSSLCLVLW